MATDHPRAIALCLFLHGDRILVSQVMENDVVLGYRPIGGGIEWCEHSRDAVAREIREELGVEVANLRLVTVLENIFTYRGTRGHEIVFVFDGESVDRTLYDREPFTYMDCDDPTHALWKRLSDFGEEARLYPDGLLPILISLVKDRERTLETQTP